MKGYISQNQNLWRKDALLFLNFKMLFKTCQNFNDDLMFTYFISFHAVRYSNRYQNIFTKSSFANSIWFCRVVKFWNFLPDNISLIFNIFKPCNTCSLFGNQLMFASFNNLLKCAAT